MEIPLITRKKLAKFIGCGISAGKLNFIKRQELR
jgi:hypothetical protein